MKKITRIDLANVFLVTVSVALLVNLILIAVHGGVLINDTLLIEEGNPLMLAVELIVVSWFIYFGLHNIQLETRRYHEARKGIGMVRRG